MNAETDANRIATIRPTDAAAAVACAAARLSVPFDGLDVASALGVHPLPVGADGRCPALDRAVGAVGLEARWVELVPGHTHAVWIAVAPDNSALVTVTRRLRRGYEVTVFEAGTHTRRRLSTEKLAQLLGRPPGAAVPALVVAVEQALAELHDKTGTIRPWARVRRLIRVEREDIWVTIVYGLAIGVLSLMLPIAVQALVTTVAFGTVLQPLVVLTLLFALASGAAGVLRLMRAWVVEVVQQRIFSRAVADVARRLAGMPYSVLDRVHVPDLMNRFFEVPTIQKASAKLLISGVGLVLQTLLGLALLAFYHPLLLAFAIVLVLLLAIVVFAMGRGAVASALDESKAKYEAVGWLEHLARIPSAFKSGSGRALALGRADQTVRHYLDARRRHFRKLILQSGGGVALAVIGTTTLLGLGGVLVLRNQLTLGQLIAAELVVASLAAAFLDLGKQLETVYDLVQATTKLGLLVDLPSERCGGEPVPPGGAFEVRCHDLGFGFGGAAVIRRCALHVPAGSKVAVTGPGGSGKSTLLDLLATLRVPTGGNLELDGSDVRLLDLRELRESVILVRGGDFIDGPVLDNLRLLRQDAPLPEVERVVERLGLAPGIRRLAQGLATPLQPSGAPLSSTQQRRVALARALIARPRLLLLDGALDELGLSDAERDAVLGEVLGPDAPWTAVVVTRDPEVARRCRETHELVDGELRSSR
jgi:putative ABC transport system ATP-binding protein